MTAGKTAPGPVPKRPAPRTLVWLASFPKSGNTWTRVFLANYVLDRPEPVPLSEIHRIGANDSGADLYGRVAGPGFRATDLSAALATRPRMLAAIAGNGADLNFVKTHNRNAAVGLQPLIPAALTRAAIYILRDPRDVALSYARHFGVSVDRAIAHLGNPENSTAADPRKVKQYLGSWSGHVASWVDADAFPVLVQRYEDMLADPEETFAKMLGFLNIPVDRARLAKAVRFSAFGELQRQEATAGFSERSANAERFFHSGTARQWEGVLSAGQLARIEADHGAAMRARGYF
ncbi:sulfotransferase domain-containing protein [Paralimibaculum aggregatum]|uniref:Sulfotransferase domain-containing protein n=1 Tax=Paralimibaculum aggregatum TaxID=3036245 RepID=A0ABQ6LTI3_9RHOB|nr:sulfotransferase domain-containing protein [Limibaculum sp. NKW23]GMG85366.1 sulfotransferase domain-containing protein [Limibaculum sp. NKW23]